MKKRPCDHRRGAVIFDPTCPAKENTSKTTIENSYELYGAFSWFCLYFLSKRLLVLFSLYVIIVSKAFKKIFGGSYVAV